MHYYATKKWKKYEQCVYAKIMPVSAVSPLPPKQISFAYMNDWEHKVTITSHFHAASSVNGK